MYYTVIQHDGHLRTQRSVENMSCRRVFSAFLHFSSIEIMWFSMFYTLINHGFLDRSGCVQGPVYIIIIGSNKYLLLAEFECCTVSYRPRFFLFNLWPECEAWVP